MQPWPDQAKQKTTSQLHRWPRSRSNSSPLAQYTTYNFTKKLKHNFGALLDRKFWDSKSQSSFNSVRYLPTNITAEVALANLLWEVPGGNNKLTVSPDRSTSYFTRLTYDYERKYLFSGTFRADASTKLLPVIHGAFSLPVRCLGDLQGRIMQNIRYFLT